MMFVYFFLVLLSLFLFYFCCTLLFCSYFVCHLCCLFVIVIAFCCGCYFLLSLLLFMVCLFLLHGVAKITKNICTCFQWHSQVPLDLQHQFMMKRNMIFSLLLNFKLSLDLKKHLMLMLRQMLFKVFSPIHGILFIIHQDSRYFLFSTMMVQCKFHATHK